MILAVLSHHVLGGFHLSTTEHHRRSKVLTTADRLACDTGTTTDATIELERTWRHDESSRGGALMIWRIVIVLFKSALMVAFFEFLNPVREAIGLELPLVGTIAGALSRATGVPYREAEIMFLLVVAVTLSQIAKAVWDVITG